MNTNRPLPYKKVLRFSQGISDITFHALLFEYFSDIPGGVSAAGERSLHGMPKSYVTLSDQWQTLINLQGPGVCSFLGFAARNNSGTQGYAYSFRAYVDGSLLHSREYRSISFGEPQSALVLIGGIFTERGTSGKLRAAYGNFCPFNRSLLVQAASEDVTNLELVAVHKSYFTR